MEIRPEVNQMYRGILKKFPKAEISISEPVNRKTGHWWVDSSYKGISVEAEFRPASGSWGVSLVEHPTKEIDIAFGQGHDEVFKDGSEALRRVLELLKER